MAVGSRPLKLLPLTSIVCKLDPGSAVVATGIRKSRVPVNLLWDNKSDFRLLMLDRQCGGDPEIRLFDKPRTSKKMSAHHWLDRDPEKLLNESSRNFSCPSLEISGGSCPVRRL